MLYCCCWQHLQLFGQWLTLDFKVLFLKQTIYWQMMSSQSWPIGKSKKKKVKSKKPVTVPLETVQSAKWCWWKTKGALIGIQVPHGSSSWFIHDSIKIRYVHISILRLNPQCQFQVVNSKNKMQQPLQPAYSLPLLTIYLTFYI